MKFRAPVKLLLPFVIFICSSALLYAKPAQEEMRSGLTKEVPFNSRFEPLDCSRRRILGRLGGQLRVLRGDFRPSS